MDFSAGLSAGHMEALRLLVAAVFPSASVLFCASPPSSSCGPAGRPGEVEDTLMARLGARQPSSHAANERRGCLLARRGPFRECCSPSEVEAWAQLYRSWPPQSVDGRQLWRCDEEEASASLEPLLPCWTPHAVVYVGGFEAPDLRRVVAPQLFAQVPPLARDAEGDRLVGGATFDYGRRKVPKFASKLLNAELLMQEKGCALHEPDLLELALPVASPSGAVARRVRTFLAVANSETSMSALRLAVDPAQRTALRSAFGYSLAALKCALPPPVVGATRLLRRWNASWSAVPVSAAFWLSAVGHAVAQMPPPTATGPTAILFGGGASSSDEAAAALAVAAASLVNSCTETCCKNYFMPLESFEAERGMRELVGAVGRLPVPQLCNWGHGANGM
ncbi:hypothetical protein DQ04_04801030 [Trypanosoma grayi]|uniref:hypothetical protein n=1 Tax=Trypanosoma grayi TaxID=71804 RepID=UPI0004F468A1|nr:hypothetical protein DQ04_04801030 [Trypanosoma grayi]KEG09691.1 hypothetical protein DQ04_04801030 [Trypanosoma grayi]